MGHPRLCHRYRAHSLLMVPEVGVSAAEGLRWMGVNGGPARDTLREAGWRERGGDRRELGSVPTSKITVETAAQST